jgi:hypothetical protein
VCALAVITLALALGALALARRVAGPSVWELPATARVAA